MSADWFYNPIILLLHVALLSALTALALALGKEFAIAWLAMLALAMNLFVLKQISLFGLHVTSSDALAVGYLLGLNLIQEFFTKKLSLRVVWISFFSTAAFTLLSRIHLAYIPSKFDLSEPHFSFLLGSLPRLVVASLATFAIVQLVDLSFFNFLRKKTKGRFLVLRIALALILSQALDTVLFSFLGLYGLVHNVLHVMVFSFTAKLIVIAMTTPFTLLSKKIIKPAISHEH